MPDPAKAAPRARPLSPHWQIYRWPVTMATSITHRVTGVGLAAGMVLVTWWLMAIAQGADAYDLFSMVARTPVGQLILFGFMWSLAFHLFNGIRHLAWDLGYGFEVATANRTGVLVVTLSLFAAIGAFGYAYSTKGLHL